MQIQPIRHPSPNPVNHKFGKPVPKPKKKESQEY